MNVHPALRPDPVTLAMQDAPLTKLILEHDALNRWLNLPFAELWADQHAEKSARLAEVWGEIRRRRDNAFPARAHQPERRVG